MKVDIADPGDVRELSEIGSKVFWDAYGGTAPDTDIEQHVASHFGESVIAKEIVSAGIQYLKVSEDDKLAGLVKLRDSDVPELLSGKSTVEVQQLYVAVDFQRRGVGALLLDAARERVRARGFDGLWLSVWSEADWATSFYRKYGFTELGKVPFTIADVEYVDYLMWLPFGD